MPGEDGAPEATDDRTRSPRVLLVASSGGHLLQLVQLKDEWPRANRAWVTFRRPDALSLLEGEQVYFAHHPTNRSVLNLIRNSFVALRVIRSFRPDAIVSTGAGVAVPFSYVGRLLGCRIIFIESFARIKGPSLTALLTYPVAHRFFVQWPDLARRFARAEYVGSVFGGSKLNEPRSPSPVLLIASSGGHLMELKQLSEAWERAERHWVTFAKEDAKSLLVDEDVTYAYYPTNRNLANLLRNARVAIKVIRRLRPRAIVTTGAGVAVPFCYVGRLAGCQIVYIESLARIHELSLSGKLIHPVAHRFFVQWPELAERVDGAEFAGSVF